MNKISINLSSAQTSSMGKALEHLYYMNRELCDMAPNRSGYPHNGGEHTLRISGEIGECEAWLELLRERYPVHAKEGVDLLLAELRGGAKNIVLKQLLRNQEK